MPRRKYLRDLSRKDTKSREQNILSPLVRDGYKAGILPRRKYLRDLSRKDTKSREQNILSPLVRDGYKAGISRDVSTVVTESGGEIKNNSVTNFKNRPFHRSQSILCNFV